jgi:outer membrane protein assembly factor BamB
MWAPAGDAEHAAAGTMQWNLEISEQGLWAPMNHAAGTLYFGSDDGGFYALDVATRQIEWRFATGDIVRSGSALLESDGIAFASDDGFLYALERDSGAERWRFDLEYADFSRRLPAGDAPYLYDYLHSSPVLDDGTLYIGSASGNLHAIDAGTGKETWRFAAGESIRSTPLIAEGFVYFGSWNGRVYALDATTGEQVWSYNTGGIIQSSPAIGDGKIFISSRSTHVYALDALTGEVQWKHRNTDGSWVESSAVFDDGMIYVGSSDSQRLWAYHADTGDVAWGYDTRGWSWAKPVVTDSTVYIGSIGAPAHGTTLPGFYVVDRRTGEERWRFVPGTGEGWIDGGVHSPPVITGGTIYVAGLDGAVYTFGDGTTVTAVEQGKQETGKTPGQSALQQAVPNPFNPYTVISYQLAEARQVELSVYDITGRRIASLANGYHQAGTHQVAWDGTDATGTAVGSGSYLYALHGRQWVKTGKIWKTGNRKDT